MKPADRELLIQHYVKGANALRKMATQADELNAYSAGRELRQHAARKIEAARRLKRDGQKEAA